MQLAKYRTRDFSDSKYVTTRKALADIKDSKRKQVSGRRRKPQYWPPSTDCKPNMMRGAVDSDAIRSRGRCFNAGLAGTPTQGY